METCVFDYLQIDGSIKDGEDLCCEEKHLQCWVMVVVDFVNNMAMTLPCAVTWPLACPHLDRHVNQVSMIVVLNQ